LDQEWFGVAQGEPMAANGETRLMPSNMASLTITMRLYNTTQVPFNASSDFWLVASSGNRLVKMYVEVLNCVDKKCSEKSY
jgi:hypothetical protein